MREAKFGIVLCVYSGRVKLNVVTGYEFRFCCNMKQADAEHFILK